MLIEARTLLFSRRVNRGKNFTVQSVVLIEARILLFSHVNRGKNFTVQSC